MSVLSGPDGIRQQHGRWFIAHFPLHVLGGDDVAYNGHEKHVGRAMTFETPEDLKAFVFGGS